MLATELLESLRPPRMRPALWHALEDLARRRDPCAVHHHEAAWYDFVRRHRQWSRLWPRTPELASVGFDLLAPARPEFERIEACVWLTMFPSLETVAAMGRIALDNREPLALRNRAVWTLGYRQLGDSDDTLWWSPKVVAAADATLASLWRSPNRDALSELLPAMRHIATPEVLDLLAEDVVAAAPALEAFATPRLAAAVMDHLAELPHEDAPRIVRLVGHTLGSDSVSPLLSYAENASVAARVEALMTALALDPGAARPAVDAYLSTLTFDRVARERAAWHQAHPGVLPTVRALAVARTTATIPAEDRTERCREACADFAGLAAIEPFYEEYLYTMWCRVALRAREDSAVVSCVESAPSLLERAPDLVEPYLDALARAGRFDLLLRTAVDHAATSHATWLLATHGRPFSALGMRKLGTDGGMQPEAVAGGALALFLAGRPDLAGLALERDRPRAEYLPGIGTPPFPGPDEQWRIEHEPESCPALAALAGGLPALLSSMKGAPEGADPDRIDFELLAERDKDLGRELAGATVCLIGVERRSELVADLQARGASIVDAPFARTDYFLAGENADPAVLTRLRAMGVRELPSR